MNIVTYALMAYGLTAVISLFMIGAIVLVNNIMRKLNIKDDVEGV